MPKTRRDGCHQPSNFTTSPGRRPLSNSHVGYHHAASEHHGGREQSHASHSEGAAGGPTGGDSCYDDPALEADTTEEEITSAAVSFAVDSAIESTASIVTGTTSTFTSSAVPIDLHLTDKIKSQIWQDEYIDFHQILCSDLASVGSQIGGYRPNMSASSVKE